MTDIRSTDFAISGYREPRGKDVARSVYVSVVLGLAAWTRPVANAERKGVEDEPATGARLAARKEAIDLDEGAPTPFRLVFKLSHEFGPTCVRNGSREWAELNHPTYVEVFDDDRLVFANESSAQLVKMVAPSVGYTSVQLRELESCLVPVFGTFRFASQTSGENALAREFQSVVLWVGHLLSGGERNERSQAKIDASAVVIFGRGLMLLSSQRRETCQRPAASRLTVTVDGCAPAGSGRLQRTSRGSPILASVNAPSSNRKALRENSADPPRLLRLKLGYLVLFEKKAR